MRLGDLRGGARSRRSSPRKMLRPPAAHASTSDARRRPLASPTAPKASAAIPATAQGSPHRRRECASLRNRRDGMATPLGWRPSTPAATAELNITPYSMQIETEITGSFPKRAGAGRDATAALHRWRGTSQHRKSTDAEAQSRQQEDREYGQQQLRQAYIAAHQRHARAQAQIGGPRRTGHATMARDAAGNTLTRRVGSRRATYRRSDRFAGAQRSTAATARRCRQWCGPAPLCRSSRGIR